MGMGRGAARAATPTPTPPDLGRVPAVDEQQLRRPVGRVVGRLLVADAGEVPQHDAPVGAARREDGLGVRAPLHLEHFLGVVLQEVQGLGQVADVVQGDLVAGGAGAGGRGARAAPLHPARTPRPRPRTVLSADPVASTNSLNGLKCRQLTSAPCASVAALDRAARASHRMSWRSSPTDPNTWGRVPCQATSSTTPRCSRKVDAASSVRAPRGAPATSQRQIWASSDPDSSRPSVWGDQASPYPSVRCPARRRSGLHRPPGSGLDGCLV